MGSPLGVAVSAVIDSTGGQLSTADGDVTVVVPAGAFTSAQTVSIQEISNNAHGAQGRAYRILPEGLHTSVEMTVRFRYNDEVLEGTTLEHLSIAYQDSNGFWRKYPSVTVDAANQTISVPTHHFSDWSRVAGMQLLPHKATVRVGQSLDLRVNYCDYVEEETSNPDELPIPPVGYACGVSPTGGVLASGWSVNGTTGGGASIGTIVPATDTSTATATYTAPATKPSPNVVAVSVRYRDGESTSLLVSNITIEEDTSDCDGYRNIDKLQADLSFDAFFHTATAENRFHSGMHAGRLMGELIQLTSNQTHGLWMGYVHGTNAGAVSINDTFQYTPPSSDGYTGSFEGSGAPVDTLMAPSMISMKLNYTTCKVDLFGSFAVNGTTTYDGESQQGAIRIGALYLYNQIIPVEQRGSRLFQGTHSISAQSSIDVTGYVPVEINGGGDWVRGGSTTARWNIHP